MPFGNLNLGNVAQALRMTSGSDSDPEWLEELRRREALQQPEQPALPPDTNRALEALGSGYRVPEQRELPPNPYEARPQESQRSIGETAFNPNANTRHLRGELIEGQNEALDLKQRQGDVAAQGYDQQAAAAGELEQQRRAGLERVSGRVDENREQQRAYEAQAHERLNQITQMVDNPPDQSRGKVLRIIGAVLSATDRGAAVGRGLQMLGQSMAGDVQGWAQQIEAQKLAQGSALAMAAHEQGDSEHELKMEQALSDMGFGVYNASIERIKAETNSQEAIRAADELQNGLRAKYVEHQLDLNARAAATGAKKQQGRADDVLERMDPELLAREIAAGNVGERGQAIYAKRMKRSQDLREGEAKIGNMTKDDAGEEVLPGYVSTVALGPADKTAIRANAMAVNDMIADIGRLREIRARNDGGSWNANDMAQAEAIQGRMSTKLSQMSGAGAPSEGERELFQRSLVDPTGFYARKDPIEIYDRMARDFRAGLETKLRAIGVVRAGSRASAGSLGFQRDPQRDPEKRLSEVTRGSTGGW